MSFNLDARVPVRIAPATEAGPQDALLTEGVDFAPETGHAPGCACCAPRTQAGRALAALLQNRARGLVPFFRRVVVAARTPAGRAEIEAALASDPVASACFRLEG